MTLSSYQIINIGVYQKPKVGLLLELVIQTPNNGVTAATHHQKPSSRFIATSAILKTK